MSRYARMNKQFEIILKIYLPLYSTYSYTHRDRLRAAFLALNLDLLPIWHFDRIVITPLRFSVYP